MEKHDKKRKPFRVKKVSELLNKKTLENNSNDANLSRPVNKTTRVEIIDLEEMKERLHELRMEQQHSINNMNFFENEIEIRNEEILRLIHKIKEIEQEK